MNNSENKSRNSQTNFPIKGKWEGLWQHLCLTWMELGKLLNGSWSSNENPTWYDSAATTYLETWHTPSQGLWTLPNVSNWKLRATTKKTSSHHKKIITDTICPRQVLWSIFYRHSVLQPLDPVMVGVVISILQIEKPRFGEVGWLIQNLITIDGGTRSPWFQSVIFV